VFSPVPKRFQPAQGKPDAPRELKVNIEDHFVFRLDWEPPVDSGREEGETFDRSPWNLNPGPKTLNPQPSTLNPQR
jgi:hypothetical protein